MTKIWLENSILSNSIFKRNNSTNLTNNSALFNWNKKGFKKMSTNALFQTYIVITCIASITDIYIYMYIKN